MEKYVLAEWPESELFMDHERFDECILVQDDDICDSSYMIPEDLYEEVMNSQD